MALRLSDLGSVEPCVLPTYQKDDRDEGFRCVDDVFYVCYDDGSKRDDRPREKRSTEKITQKNQTASPFLRLPAELRKKIYKLVFHAAIIPINKPRTRKDVLGRHHSVRAILFTCRQIHSEANALSFRHCIFKPSYFALRFLSSSNLCAAGFGNIQLLWLTNTNGRAVVDGKMEKTDLKAEFASLKRVFLDPWKTRVKFTGLQCRDKMRTAFGIPELEVGLRLVRPRVAAADGATV